MRFETKLRTLNGRKFQTERSTRNSLQRRKVWRRKEIEWYDHGPKSALALHLASSMNVTFTRARSSYEFYVSLELRLQTKDTLNGLWLKSFEIEKCEIYTPVIYDSQSSINIDYLFFYTTAVILTLLLLRVCCILGSFDRRTWSPYEVVKMLFGYSNPRNPNR